MKHSKRWVATIYYRTDVGLIDMALQGYALDFHAYQMGAHLALWALVPPRSPHKLAKTGHFVSVDGIDTYYERYGSGSPLILIPAGGNHTSTWRFNIEALST